VEFGSDVSEEISTRELDRNQRPHRHLLFFFLPGRPQRQPELLQQTETHHETRAPRCVTKGSGEEDGSL